MPGICSLNADSRWLYSDYAIVHLSASAVIQFPSVAATCAGVAPISFPEALHSCLTHLPAQDKIIISLF